MEPRTIALSQALRRRLKRLQRSKWACDGNGDASTRHHWQHLHTLFRIAYRTKAAAEELQKAAGVNPDRLREQAAAAVSQAQDLAKGTVEELFKGQAKPSDAQASSSSGKHSADQGPASMDEKASSGPSSSQSQSRSKDSTSDDTAADRPGFGTRLRAAASTALQEMRAAVLPETPSASALRGAAAKAGDIQTSSSSALVAAPMAEEAAWRRQWRRWGDTLGDHPFFKSMAGLRDSKVVTAGRDVADSIRERWETSDSPLVHRIQDATDALFAEGEAAAALREIRARDPSFDMVRFLQLLRGDVPTMIRAYLRGEEAEVSEHCTPEMVERLTGIIRAQKAAGLIPDATLLDSSDVELVDVKTLDDEPIVVVQFTCQQINCTRDTAGNVVEGGPDEVHRVYYYWALQQERSGYVGEDGAAHPPRWRLREMLIRGMHHLL
jgi:mitochondrial import inner membrane translocase subunit TIM44